MIPDPDGYSTKERLSNFTFTWFQVHYAVESFLMSFQLVSTRDEPWCTRPQAWWDWEEPPHWRGPLMERWSLVSMAMAHTKCFVEECEKSSTADGGKMHSLRIYNISTSEEHLSRLCSTIFSVYIILGKCRTLWGKHAWASCMHFSYWGENQVSNLMSISEVTIVVESLHCWHQSSFVRHRLSCQLNYSTVLSKCRLLLFTFVICTFNAFSASLHVH